MTETRVRIAVGLSLLAVMVALHVAFPALVTWGGVASAMTGYVASSAAVYRLSRGRRRQGD